MSHQEVNRGYWAEQAPGYAETARRDWAAEEPYWGIWKIPEAEVGALPDVDGLDAIELGCGTAYFSPGSPAAARGRSGSTSRPSSSPPPAPCRPSTASSSR